MKYRRAYEHPQEANLKGRAARELMVRKYGLVALGDEVGGRLSVGSCAAKRVRAYV